MPPSATVPKPSTSLAELTSLCQRVTCNSVPIGSEPATSPVDIPWYVSDFGRAEKAFGWRPQKDVEQIVGDIHAWLTRDRVRLAPLFAPGTPA